MRKPDIHALVTHAHEQIREVASAFLTVTPAISRRRYEAVIQEYVCQLNDKLEVYIDDSSEELDSSDRTEMMRVNLINNRFEIYLSSYFFRTEVGAGVSSMPMNAIYFIALAAKNYDYPMMSVLVELNDRAFGSGIGQSSNNPEAILIPDLAFFLSDGYRDFKARVAQKALDEERVNGLIWRGSTTGVRRYEPLDVESDFGWLARLEAIKLLNDSRVRNHIDVKFSRVVQIDDPDRMRSILEKHGLFGERIDQEEFSRYTLVLDIDGNSNSWPGLFGSLLTGCCVIKVNSESGFRQWYYSGLVPWVNYVPVASDLSDIVDVVERLLRNRDMARQIGRAGRSFALSLDYERELSEGVANVSRLLKFGSL